ncbi:MAG TPA: rhodanese-like domain-containing protein [Gemmatimonadaceae bacterium]|nr:rhodanese-like domain-containing protein [Gemmatimonadaceae bacterium]
MADAVRAVAREEDHVTALELAAWIRDRRPGLRILDLRSPAEFDAYHVPGAERADIQAVPSLPFRAGETIVLYSEGGTHAAQAWLLLRALGYRRVYFLRGGLYEWLEQVIDPVLPAGDDAATRAERARIASLSRYFGGMPSVLPRAPREDALPIPGARASGTGGGATGSSAASLQRIRRRGC